MFEFAEVNAIMKIITNTIKDTSWHFINLPIRFKPYQFMMTYPRITPKIPYKELDAPIFTSVPIGDPGLQTAEKIFPPIPAKI